MLDKLRTLFSFASAFAFALVCVPAAAGLLWPAAASGYSIRQIQETAAADGASPHDGATVDCSGGVVIHKFGGSAPRVLLYDPAAAGGWGGIQVKDWTTGAVLYNGLSIGDWVSFTGIPVQEYRGTTFLQYDPLLAPGVAFAVGSTGNSLPSPLAVAAAEIAAPVETTPEFWLVADHSAEKYESMLVEVQDVLVTAVDLGKAMDNYSLQAAGGADVWAADYMNADKVGLYDPKVAVGKSFQSVSGILEQYTKIQSIYAWDYYQLLTTSTDCLVVPEPASLMLAGCGGAWLLRRRR